MGDATFLAIFSKPHPVTLIRTYIRSNALNQENGQSANGGHLLSRVQEILFWFLWAGFLQCHAVVKEATSKKTRGPDEFVKKSLKM
jgi:hypothetical protein